jgi:hypothetical protein
VAYELGHNHVDSGQDLQQGNYIAAFGPFSVADGGPIVAAFLHVRVVNTGRKFKVALYPDVGGVPAGGAPLATSAEGSLDATGWVEVAMSAFALVKDTYYWIVVICDGNWAYYFSAVTNGMRGYAARTYTDGFPNPFPAGGATYNEHPAGYVTYTPAGGSPYTLAADVGVFGLTGQGTVLRAARQLPAETGAFAEAGIDAALRAARRLVADIGSFALTGQDVKLLATRKLPAAVGSFILTGQPADLNYSGGAGPNVAVLARVLWQGMN